MVVLPDLVVPECRVGVVHYNDEFNLSVGDIAEHFLMLGGVERPEVKLPV